MQTEMNVTIFYTFHSQNNPKLKNKIIMERNKWQICLSVTHLCIILNLNYANYIYTIYDFNDIWKFVLHARIVILTRFDSFWFEKISKFENKNNAFSWCNYSFVEQQTTFNKQNRIQWPWTKRVKQHRIKRIDTLLCCCCTDDIETKKKI